MINYLIIKNLNKSQILASSINLIYSVLSTLLFCFLPILLMSRLFLINVFLLIGLLAVRCAREVIIDLPEEPSRIVAVGKFTANDTFRVRVTLTQPIYDPGEVQAPADANVTVAKEGELYARLYRQTTPQGIYWKSRKPVEPNVEYTLNVQIGGYPLASATSSVPKHLDIKPVSINHSEIAVEQLSDGSQQLRIPLALQLANPLADPFPEHLYFAFNLTSDIDAAGFTIERQQAYFAADGRTLSLLHNIPENAVLINEKYWSEGLRTLYLDALIPFKPNEDQYPVRLYVEWLTLSEEFYRYHLSVARQGSNLPLSEPDAVFNNVVNGYGNFSGYSTSTQIIDLPK